MQNKRIIVILTILAVIGVVAWVGAAGAFVDQKSSLSGQVLSDGLAAPGTNVREGDILVLVDTLTGPMPAVRATVDGQVRDVLVHPGDRVQAGAVLVRLEPAQK